MGEEPRPKSKLKKLIDSLGLEEVRYHFDPEFSKKATEAFATKDFSLLADVYPLDLSNQQVREKIGDFLDAHAGVLREDLLFYFEVLVLRSRKDEELLVDFKDVLPVGHYRMLMIASSVVELEDRTFARQAKRLRNEAIAKYGEDQKRIYNLHRSGYIEGFFHFWLQWLKYEFALAWREKFLELWNHELEFFDQAVWVSDFMTSEQVAKEVLDRLAKRGVKEVRVYARGLRKMDLVEVASSHLADKYDNLRIKTEGYRLGKDQCTCYTVKRIDLRRPVKRLK